jgi:hypothetical protein
MFKNLNYRTTRALHICIVFATSIFIEMQLNIPRGAWTGFTVMLIYTGFDVGSSIQRIFYRFLGVLLGLQLAHILWFLGYVNFRLLLLIIATTLFCYYYFLGKSYAYATIFTTTLSVIGSDYFGDTTFHIQWYERDYFMCTVLAVVICIFFEYFIFFRINMTRKFYLDLQQEIISQLENFLIIMQKEKIKKSTFLHAVFDFNKKITDLNTFTQNTKNDYHNKDDLIAELNEFSQYTNAAYQNLRKLVILPQKQHEPLLIHTSNLILKLKKLVNVERRES